MTASVCHNYRVIRLFSSNATAARNRDYVGTGIGLWSAAESFNDAAGFFVAMHSPPDNVSITDQITNSRWPFPSTVVASLSGTRCVRLVDSTRSSSR